MDVQRTIASPWGPIAALGPTESASGDESLTGAPNDDEGVSRVAADTTWRPATVLLQVTSTNGRCPPATLTVAIEAVRATATIRVPNAAETSAKSTP